MHDSERKQMEIERTPDGFRLDARVSLGDLISVVTAVVLVTLAYGALSARLAVAENEQGTIKQQLDRLSLSQDRTIERIDIRLQRIEDKLSDKVDKAEAGK